MCDIVQRNEELLLLEKNKMTDSDTVDIKSAKL